MLAQFFFGFFLPLLAFAVLAAVCEYIESRYL
jgi:hypothetical protein